MWSFTDKTTQQVKITCQIVAKWSCLLTQLTWVNFNTDGAAHTAIAINHKKSSTNWNVPNIIIHKRRGNKHLREGFLHSVTNLTMSCRICAEITNILLFCYLLPWTPPPPESLFLALQWVNPFKAANGGFKKHNFWTQSEKRAGIWGWVTSFRHFLSGGGRHVGTKTQQKSSHFPSQLQYQPELAEPGHLGTFKSTSLDKPKNIRGAAGKQAAVNLCT